ncbi:prolyl oligopeptidase [Amphiplicatus metriothermophilus]|uniref:Prolyl oligopeptidase n=2 Tax=Amphiplicatus metriothermophilus TaxID=1519374 RepID=A0A239PJU5_9PROT|nr:prolyl oligopeptidase [Amphiplicatus metriothermophilus]
MVKATLVAASLAAAQGAAAQEGAPAAAQEDPFLWLEEIDGARALDWVRAQNARSLAELEGDARFEAFHRAALEIFTSEERIPAPGLVGETVRNFWQDGAHVRGIWREASLESYLAGAPDWRLILDIDALAEAEGENWVYKGADCLAPAHDRCIVNLSRGGADAAARREFLVSEGTFVENGFSFAESKGTTAWVDEDALLVGVDFGEGTMTTSGYPRTTRLVRRGEDPASARVVFEGAKTDVGVWPYAIVRGGKTWLFVTRALTFFESEHYLLDDAFEEKKLPLPAKSNIQGVLDGFIVASIQEDWAFAGRRFRAGDIVAIDPAGTKAELVFSPNEHQAVGGVAASESALFVQLLDNIVGKVKKIERRGGKWRARDVALPGEGDVSLGSVNAHGDDLFLYFDSPTVPQTLFYVSAAGERARVKQNPAFFDAAGVVMRQHEATSKNGTKVPYFVIGREDVMEAGNAPTIQYGYGGFEVPVTPGYSGTIGKLWYERGGLYVIANIRGGGEFGPRWHQAALKENRQRAFDDFFAVSEDLIARGLTSPQKLGAYGGSNGGLLMGVALTQRPDLYGAIAIGVPLLDMLRFHKLLAGASWMGEYGNPDIAEERAYIEKYSPYQNLRPDAAYPRVFFFTSTRDDRVHPGHARKMAAKMAAMGHDFLYYENIEGGHGAAANQKQAAYRTALQYVYFARQLMDGPASSASAGE